MMNWSRDENESNTWWCSFNTFNALNSYNIEMFVQYVQYVHVQGVHSYAYINRVNIMNQLASIQYPPTYFEPTHLF